MPGYSFSENLLYLLCGLGILQGILLAGLIYFHHKSDRTVNLFLALYIFFVSCVMTIPFVINLVGWKNSFFIQPVSLLPGILLYFYICSFKETITWKKLLPHLAPVLLFALLSYLNLSAIKRSYPDTLEALSEALQRPFSLIVIGFRILQQYVYYFLTRRALKSYQHSIQLVYSETSRIDLHWAGFLVNGYIILISAFLVIFPLMIRYPAYFNVLLLANMVIATPYIYLAAYRGFKQPTIWQLQSGKTKTIVEKELTEAQTNGSASGRGEDERPLQRKSAGTSHAALMDRIIDLLEKERIYQEPELTLQQLATQLASPAYLVSQAINEEMKKNFYELVNGYRVEEAKRLLLHPDNRNYTILSVGFEAGFNSKTTFNTVFKKITGLTPTEFRDKRILV